MSVGLYDVDFSKYHQVMFNLEIMKMATYFKGKREITVLSPTYSPERYTHFYLRKDFYDGDFPVGLNKHDNLQYGGIAFNNGRYLALPEDIERTVPDTYVYDRYKKLYVEGAKLHGAAYTTMTQGLHLRLSLDGKTVWNKVARQLPDKKARCMFFHDPNLGEIEDALYVIGDLTKKFSIVKDGACSIGAKFPINISGLEEFSKWNEFVFSDNFFTLNLREPLCDEEFCTIVDSIGPTKIKHMTYTVADASSSKNDFIMYTLPQIFKQTIFCCRQHKKILLNIDDDFIIEPEWREVVTLLNLYMSAAQSYGESVPALYVFCKNLRSREGQYKNGVMCKEDARRIFNFVYERQPELFKLFYECNQVKLINGGLENVSCRP